MHPRCHDPLPCYLESAMKMLKRAASETRRELGINWPTALTAILAIAITIAIVGRFSSPETDSLSGSLLWLLQSIAWSLAVVAAFAPLFVLNIAKVGRRDRSACAKLRMEADSASSEDAQMKSFLRNTLGDSCYGVEKCYVFGSVIKRHPTRDVDVIVQFDSSKPGRVRACRDRLRDVEGLFQDFYGLKLHVQIFLCTEDEALYNFLQRAGNHERLK